MTTWPDVDLVISLHETVMRHMGWTPAPLRDRAALESAIVRPQMAAHYEDADLIRQAALLSISISQAQAFIDGNKRTAFVTLKLFLNVNSFDLVLDPLVVARKLEIVAESDDRRTAADDFETWLRSVVVTKE